MSSLSNLLCQSSCFLFYVIVLGLPWIGKFLCVSLNELKIMICLNKNPSYSLCLNLDNKTKMNV